MTSSKARAARLRDEEEAERLYEEAVGQASTEQQAMQGLAPEGANSHTPTPTEDSTKLGEEVLPPGEEPPRTGSSYAALPQPSRLTKPATIKPFRAPANSQGPSGGVGASPAALKALEAALKRSLSPTANRRSASHPTSLGWQ
jgi:type II secretory pathway pseudopilin PulG